MIHNFHTTVILAIIGIGMVSCGGKKTEEKQSLTSVNVAEAVTDSVVLYKEYPGVLTAGDKVEIVARVNGTIQSVNYNSGDMVKKGQLLFTIESSKYNDAVQQARAALETARSTREYASAHYAAMEKALVSNAVSVMEVKQAKSALEQAEASIVNARAALQTATTNLGYCRIYAPISGRITANVYGVGNYVNGEASPIRVATIYNDDKLNANFSIEDASFLRSFASANARENINYDSIPITFTEQLPHTYTGRLHYMSPEVDASTGTMVVQAEIENPYGELRDGMYVTVSLPYMFNPKAVLVKDAAISTDQLGKFIYTVNDSNKVVYTPITTGGVVRDSMRVVVKGVAAGTPYVTEALLKVRSGMEVKPVMIK